MILVFDLDDTLYEELSFVRSGFRKVAGHLHAIYGLNPEEVYERLMMKLQEGRGKVFDKVLEEYGICTRKLITRCLSIYRYHKPEIHLYDDAVRCLERFSELPKYVVTDGNKIVQANKIEALGLMKYIKFAYITHRYGIKHAKPSDYVFRKICKTENADPQQILYVGDNPSKDFVGIKPGGFKTVRIFRGNYKNIYGEKAFEADRNIFTLDDLTQEFLNSLS